MGRVAERLPASVAGSRVARMFDTSKGIKMHDVLLLAGPIGAYLMHLARALGAKQRTAITLMLNVIGELWAKVIRK